MGSTWPFLLMYESHDMRHIGFRRLTVVNGTSTGRPGSGTSTGRPGSGTSTGRPGSGASQEVSLLFNSWNAFSHRSFYLNLTSFRVSFVIGASS